MKKYSILLLSILTAAACTQENTKDIAPEFNPNSKLIVRGTFDEESTRITTEDGLGFALEANSEKIGVYIRNGEFDYTNILFTAGDADENGWISFSSTEEGYKIYETSQIFSYAPYRATSINVNGSTDGGATEQAVVNGKWDGKRTMNLPSEQMQSRANDFSHLATYYAIVAAPATPTQDTDRNLDSYSVDLQFSGVFSLVRFVLENSQDSDVAVSKLILSGDAALTGNFNVDLTHNDPSLTNSEYAPEAVEGQTLGSVEVNLATPAVLKSGEQTEIFAVVNAATVKTPKVTVYATMSGKDVVFEKEFASDKTFTRNKRIALGVKLENPVAEDYAQEVIDALQKGGDVTIEKDVDLSGKATVASNGALMIEIPEGTKLNLNIPTGVTVTLDKDADNIRIFNYGEITISGEGTIAGANGVMRNYGTATVESGNFKTTVATGGTALCNENGGTMIINDANVDAACYALYNDNGNMTINGGTFKSSSNSSKGGWGYCLRATGQNSVTTIGQIGDDDSKIIIAGVQGGASADTYARLIINSGTYATYPAIENPENKNLHFYALYIATMATAEVNGGRFYREYDNLPCIRIGNNDTGTTFGKMELRSGYYKEQGLDDTTKANVVPADGYKWVKLETPITESVEFYGKTYTNTYNYQIVEGVEDLGYTETENGYEIHNAAGLTWFAEQVNGGNNFSGKTIVLTADIDLDGIAWKPIGTNPDSNTLRFNGIFDGQDHIISNLNVNTTTDGVPSGLFGAVSGTVKNFKIEHATINSVNTQTNRSTGVAVGIGYPSAKIQNVTVTDATVNAYRQVGGVVGYLYGTVSGCTVNGLTIEAPLDNTGDNGDKVGGIAGFMGGDSGICFDNTVTNANIKAYRDVGGILGLIYAGSVSTFKNNTISDSTIEGTKGDKSSNAGAIVGRYMDSLTSSDIDPSNTATNVTVIPVVGTEVATADEAIAAINAGGKVNVVGAIDKIDFTALNPAAPVELVLNAKVGEIVLGSAASNPAQTTITIAKDVDYPAFSVAKGNDIKNLTIIGDPTSSKACTSGINALNAGITTVQNVTVRGVRFQGKGVHFGFTANPQTTENIVVEDCVATDMMEQFFHTHNNKYEGTVVGNITIRNNHVSFSESAASNANGIYICETTTGDVIIEGNTFINVPYAGIQASNNLVGNFIIRNNTITNSQKDCIKIDYPNDKLVIENNILTPGAEDTAIRVARFDKTKNPTVTITGNRIDMSNMDSGKIAISITQSDIKNLNAPATVIVKDNIKAGGEVDKWFNLSTLLTVNADSDTETPFNN